LAQDFLGVFRGYGASPQRRKEGEFFLSSPFQPSGDQGNAISSLIQGLEKEYKDQVLLGVTGSGKTFTMANIIAKTQRPALILAPNKTLAAQLYEEMKEFFPRNAVEYFVSYYDYYQPEAYVPHTNTYIEKEATINEQIERLRHSATRSLLEREDVIVVASISCIYGLGNIDSYQGLAITLAHNQKIAVSDLSRQLTSLQYARNDIEFTRGTFRVRGDRLDIFPAHYEDRAWSFSFFGSEIESIHEIESLTGHRIASLKEVTIYPNNHYVTPGPTIQQAVGRIREELTQRVQEFESCGKLLEAQRLKERVTYDMETLVTTGICPGIENYSPYLTGRPLGTPPPTLMEYLSPNSLLIVDESHVAVPQIRGMSVGDAVRKTTLSEYGFRLPSCRNNRPLTFEEWDIIRPQTLFVSATPGPWEMTHAQSVAQQVIRPTGLLDPLCFVHPTEGQIDHLMGVVQDIVQQKGRVLITTLTKKMAEDLSEYLTEASFKARYMHSDIDTLERIQLLRELRQGVFDVLVGINLLREGLDIPECQMVAILDADKEGYLRSKTSLIQTMGRAARHPKGHVWLYADKMTNSLKEALEETSRRRLLQEEYNKTHGITPQAVMRSKGDSLQEVEEELPLAWREMTDQQLHKEMLAAAKVLDFERASLIKKILQKREEA
jgi:excinuclease ABC subunit B